MKKHGIDRLGAEEKLDLLGEIWDSLDAGALPLTDAQRTELEARLREHTGNPDDVVPWDEVKRTLLPPHGSK